MKGKILWLEDDYDILKRMIKPLVDEGYSFKKIRTLSDYMKISNDEFNEFNLAIIDLLLPYGSDMEEDDEREVGFKVILHIRRERNSQIPIIVTTGISRVVSEIAENIHGYDPIIIIQKVIRPTELQAEVARFLEEKVGE